MTAALDFSSARPSGEEIVAAGAVHALAYTGSGKPRPSRDYIESLLAAGVSFTFIQESYATRAQEGHQAGLVDAEYADTQADGVGYPLDAAIVYCASDGTRTNPGPGAAPAISEYGRGVADVTRRPILAYGNRTAVDAFRAGAGTLCVGTWVPSTWDAIPGTDVLIQEPNIASPIPDTDWNTVYGTWPCWSSQAPPPKKEELMQPRLYQAPGENIVWVYDLNNHTKTRVHTPEALGAIQSVWALNGVPNQIDSNATTAEILSDAVELGATAGAQGGPLTVELAGKLTGTATP